MARPIKQGFDYFPVDTVFNDQMQALEMMYGNDGFAWMFKAWQRGYQNGTGLLDLNSPFDILMAASARIDVERQIKIVATCLSLGLLAEKEPSIYVMNGVIKRIERMNLEREKGKNRAEKSYSAKNAGSSENNRNSSGLSREDCAERKGKERKDIYSREILDITSLLNQTCGTSYKPNTKASAYHIEARLREGFTLPDFETVIKSKNSEWGKDPDWKRYLRPQTLFGPKFESYLQAAKQIDLDKPKRAPGNAFMEEAMNGSDD